jgi:hypothetical protein
LLYRRRCHRPAIKALNEYYKSKVRANMVHLHNSCRINKSSASDQTSDETMHQDGLFACAHAQSGCMPYR